MEWENFEISVYPLVKNVYDTGVWSKNTRSFPIGKTEYEMVMSADGYYLHIEILDTFNNTQVVIYDGRTEVMYKWLERVERCRVEKMKKV